MASSRRFQLARRRPQHADANRQQQGAQYQRGSGLEALVAVGVIGIGVFLAVVTGEQHDKVGDQIRQRVNAVGDQTLRLGDDTDHNLGEGQDQVDADADSGAAGGRRYTFGWAMLEVFAVVCKLGKFHNQQSVRRRKN